VVENDSDSNLLNNPIYIKKTKDLDLSPQKIIPNSNKQALLEFMLGNSN
jgi:hypothetical protein